MNISVMDNGANLVGFLRMDGAWLGSVDIAMKKVRALPTINHKPKTEVGKKTIGKNKIPSLGFPFQAKTAVFFQMDTDIIGSLSQVDRIPTQKNAAQTCLK